jgi:hypothetical protein
VPTVGSPRPARVNRAVLSVLRSPIGGVISGRVCALRFRGRRTGRLIVLPVEYARTDLTRLVVLAGRGRNKQWWRNFRASHPVEVWLDGGWRAARGVALCCGDAGRAEAIAAYRTAHARLDPDTDDPVVSIELDTVPAARREPGPWLAWFRAVTVGECLGFAAPATVGVLTAHTATTLSVPLLVLAGFVEGGVLGWFQARVLRRLLPGLPAGRWIVATAAAAALSWAIGLVPGILGGSLTEVHPAVLVPLVAVGALVLLLSIGTAQWIVLRDHVDGAGRWVWGTAAAWLVALGAFLAVTTPLWHEGQHAATAVLVGVLGGLVMAMTVAMLTGLVVVRVIRPAGGHRRAGRRATTDPLLAHEVHIGGPDLPRT